MDQARAGRSCRRPLSVTERKRPPGRADRTRTERRRSPARAGARGDAGGSRLRRIIDDHVQPVAEAAGRSRTPGRAASGRARGRGGSSGPTISSRSSPRISCLRLAGVSAASSFPPARSPTREQRSASSMYGVVMTIVIPAARSDERIFQKSRRETGSTPVVGSSSRRSLGACGQACRRGPASASCPPERFSARRRRKGARRVNSSSSSRRSAKSRGRGGSRRRTSMFSSTVRSP